MAGAVSSTTPGVHSSQPIATGAGQPPGPGNPGTTRPASQASVDLGGSGPPSRAEAARRRDGSVLGLRGAIVPPSPRTALPGAALGGPSEPLRTTVPIGGRGLHATGDAKPGRDIEMASLTRLPVRAASSGLEPGSSAPSDVAPTMSLAAFPGSFPEIQAAIQTARQRQVNTALAAELVNELRAYGPAAHRSQAVRPANSNAELMGRITSDQVARWYRAQGVTPAELDAMRRAAFMAGLPSPAAGLLGNCLQYIVVPAIGAATGRPWLSFGLGAGAAVAQVPLASVQQPGVVTASEHLAERNGPYLEIEKTRIHYKNRLSVAARQVSDLTAALVRESGEFDLRLARIAARNPDAALHADLSPADLQRRLVLLDAAEQHALVAQSNLLATAGIELYQRQEALLMTQGAHQRQRIGNAWQILPRTLRAPVTGSLALLAQKPLALAATQQTVGSVFGLGPFALVGAQAAMTLGVTLVQHLLAAVDETKKLTYKNKLNLMYADLFNEHGARQMAAGLPLTAAGIDEAKLRSLVVSPSQSLVKRVDAILRSRIKEDTAAIDCIGADAEAARRRSSADRPSREGIGRDAGPSDIERNSVDALRHSVAALEADRVHLASGEVTRLQPDGVAAGLLEQGLKGFLSGMQAEDIANKYKKPGELNVQMAQRFGQAFHMGVAGSAVASVLGKLNSAIAGGTANASATSIGAVLGASTLLAGIGAASQHATIAVKNHSRETEKPVGVAEQAWRGIWAGPSELTGQLKADKAIREANVALDVDTIASNLRLANLLTSLPSG